jgi:isoamyl acetate esterase
MHRVVLIGDSIRMGYQEEARRALGTAVTLWAPAENGGNSENVRQHIADWLVAQAPDVLHINCGLHDIKTAFGATAKAIGIGAYRYNVERILQAAQRIGAAVIWATSTPVNYAWHHANKEFDRYEADVRAYNEVAAEVAIKLGVPINDLYGVVMAAGRDALLLPDGVHYRPEGYALLGAAVARAIEPYL